MYSKSFKNWVYAYLNLFIFISYQPLYGEVLSIDDHFTKIGASSYMEFAHDINSSFELNSLHTVPWKKVTNSNLSPAKTYPTWTRFVLHNNTLKSKTIVLQNPRAGMDRIDVYIFRKKSMESLSLGDQIPLSLRAIPDRYSMFPLHLDSNETVVIATRLINAIGSTEGEWIIYSETSYHLFDSMEMLWWGLFGGITIALLLYAIPTLIAIKDFYLALFFTLFSVSSFFYQYSLNGLLYLFGVSTFWVNRLVLFFGISFGMFTALLIIRFLQKAKKYGIVYKAAIFFTIMMLIELIILVVGIFDHKIMQIAGLFNMYFGIFAYMTWFAMMPELIKLTLDRRFVYFFIGYSFIIAAYTLQGLVVAGILEISFVSIYGVSAASLVETFCFLLGISFYIKMMESDKKKKEKLIEFQMRFASIGKVIGNIAHQWKVPLVRSGTLLTEIESTLLFKKDLLAERLQEVVPQMKTNLRFMQDTVDEFYNLYSAHSKTTKFSLNDSIMEIWTMLHAKSIKHNASINVHQSAKDITIITYAHSFSHIIMILIDNFLDISGQREIKTPQLNITAHELENEIEIVLEDNCGGIKQNPIKSVFDIDTTTKSSDTQSGGMGLAIAKIIVEEKLKGKIEVYNTEQGAKFILQFPLQAI